MNDILRQLQLDQTFFQVFILFWVFFFLFSKGVIKPLQRLMALRTERTRQEREKILEISKVLEEQTAILESQTRSLRLDIEAQVEQIRRAAELDAAGRVQVAREQVRQMVQQAQLDLQKEEKKMLQEIQTQVEPLVELGVERLLGRRSQ